MNLLKECVQIIEESMDKDGEKRRQLTLGLRFVLYYNQVLCKPIGNEIIYTTQSVTKIIPDLR